MFHTVFILFVLCPLGLFLVNKDFQKSYGNGAY